MIPGNPYAQLIHENGGLPQAMTKNEVQAAATLALAYEQHQRNRLAAITAKYRGLKLPADLDGLTREDSPADPKAVDIGA